MRHLKLIALCLFLLTASNCRIFQAKEPPPIDEVEQFANDIGSKIEALYIEEKDDDFLKGKLETKESKEGKEYVKYSAEKAFPNRLISVQVNELTVGSKKYYKVIVVTKTADNGKRSVERIEMRQDDIKNLIEKINIALRKVL